MVATEKSNDRAAILEALRRASTEPGVAFRLNREESDGDVFLRFVDDERDPKFILDADRSPFSPFPEDWAIHLSWEGFELKRDEGSVDGLIVSHSSTGEEYDIEACVIVEAEYPLFPGADKGKMTGTQEFVVCPKCGSEELISSGMERDVGIAWSRATCKDCGFEAKELFDLVFWKEV